MNCNRLGAVASVVHPQAMRARLSPLEKRRRYNRLYMRSWRADPRHQARERAHRRRWHYERKLRDSLRAHDPYANDYGDPVCGFCRRHPPVTKVWRLEIRDLDPSGYVEIRVPYCGEC